MSDWIPVSQSKPCAICKKPHWCLISPDDKAHLCNRIQSDHPAKGGGWIHGTPERVECPTTRRSSGTIYDKPAFNSSLWWSTARHVARIECLLPWAEKLGLPVESIDWLGAATLGSMLTFPMYDGAGNICGIRTRTPDGQKKAITGSKAGVFIATIQLTELDVLICEGPTDAAAALALDFEPIGRPSCIGQEQHVLDTLRRWNKDRATICADADGPGIAGAERLADALKAGKIAVRMVTPTGCKDLREWYQQGITREIIDSAWSQQKWRTT